MNKQATYLLILSDLMLQALTLRCDRYILFCIYISRVLLHAAEQVLYIFLFCFVTSRTAEDNGVL